jgi:type I restriction enzyme M protein
MEEIETNGYNLNISRYISTAMSEEEIELSAVNGKLETLEKKIVATREKHNAFLKRTRIAPTPISPIC